VPVDTLLRLLYLKHRYQLGYERLCREVADSISWRRYCRIGLDRPVPHPTTLVKLVRRAGPEVVDELNAALLGKLASGKLPRARKLRMDTTGWRPISTIRPTPTCWSTRQKARWAGAPGQGSWGGQPDPVPRPWPGSRASHEAAGPDAAAAHRVAMGEVDRLTGEVAQIARHTLRRVQVVARNARRAGARRPGGSGGNGPFPATTAADRWP
jgi:transposase, IS5 family